jgi:hypothetical protein
VVDPAMVGNQQVRARFGRNPLAGLREVLWSTLIVVKEERLKIFFVNPRQSQFRSPIHSVVFSLPKIISKSANPDDKCVYFEWVHAFLHTAKR